MSSQSDILSPDDQSYLYEQLAGDNMDQVVNIFNEPTLNSLNYLTGTIITEDEEDSKVHVSPFMASVQTSILSNDEYSGPYEFEVDVHPSVAKNSWVYSPSLNKVYMTMRSPFPVDFKISHKPQDMFIRCTPVYSAPQFAQECVYRCLNHEFSQEKSDGDLGEHIRPHIIRCANPFANYLGDKSKNERLSVVIPFSTCNVREIFEFVCKNSCPSPGMNRRAVEIIFTLEDSQGRLYGRKTLNVRICSCPKRDKEKDEKDTNPPHGKKRKIEKLPKKPVHSTTDNDSIEYTLTIPVVGKHNEQSVLKYCHDLMAGEILRNVDHGTDGPYKIALNKINTLIRERSE